MRIVVTGATGLVGQQVCRAALDAGHDVVALARDRKAPLARALTAYEQRTAESRPGGGLTLARGDLTDDDSLARALAGADALVHCAAIYAFGSAFAGGGATLNDEGTRAVLEAAADAGVRRAVVTSSSVTRGSSLLPEVRSERDELGLEPQPAYYASKLAQERTALAVGAERGIEVVLALPTVVLGGPWTTLAPSNAILLRFLLDPTRSTYPGGADLVDARDIAAGHLALLERGVAGERYLLGGAHATWRELHSLIAELVGAPGPYLEAGAPVAALVAGVAEAWARLAGTDPLATVEEASTVGRYYWYDSSRAAALGYAARPLRETVSSALAWLLVSAELPRWVRESLTVSDEVRAARPLVPHPLPGAGSRAGR